MVRLPGIYFYQTAWRSRFGMRMDEQWPPQILGGYSCSVQLQKLIDDGQRGPWLDQCYLFQSYPSSFRTRCASMEKSKSFPFGSSSNNSDTATGTSEASRKDSRR